MCFFSSYKMRSKRKKIRVDDDDSANEEAVLLIIV